MTTTLARNWWVLLVRGIFAILFGVLAIIFPGAALQTLALIYGAYALLDGIFALVSIATSAEGRRHGWSLLFEGIVGIITGIIAFVWPLITLLAFLYLIAAWSIITGVMEIVTAVQLRKQIQGEFFMILSGVISIIFGILLIFLPEAGLLTIAWIVGLYAIFFGFIMIGLSLRLRRHHTTSTGNPSGPTGSYNLGA